MSWLTILAAYGAAGVYFVLRELKLAPTDGGQLRGLAVVAALWLPITLHSAMTLARTKGLEPAARQFATETAAPLLLFIALVAIGSG